jgi:type IV pilus assembly protein PilP
MNARYVLLLGAVAAMAGCGAGDSDLERYIADVKARKSRDIEPIPQVKPYQPYEYSVAGRRDPFVLGEPASAPIGNADGPRPDPRRNREPLEEYPLDALRMMGIISTPSATFALIRAPDAVIHRVGLHDHLGQDYGEVIAINESEITLLELVPDGFGGWTQRRASVALSQ